MSRTTPTILCNLCMVEDLENGKVVLQYRSPEKTHWAGYAFPGGHIEEGESLVESITTSMCIEYIVFCYKATKFTGHLRSSDEGEVSWVEKDQLEKLDLSYDMLPLLEVMEDPDLSEYYYRKRTDDGWDKLRF